MQFQSIIGQNEIIHQLIKLKKNHRIGHSLLFLGKAGYGGLPLAMSFAQFLLCENPGENDSCGVCAACQKCSHLQHPDLHFSFPTVLSVADRSDLLLKSWRELVLRQAYFDLSQWIFQHDDKGRKPTIGTTESQEIIKKLSLKSFEGGYKIMLVWMAEEMNVDCANKLLKILEEPPENTLFILLCESIDQMLPTILSRTQLVHLNAIPHQVIAKALIQKMGIQEEQANAIAHLANGDFVDALKIKDEGEGGKFNEEQFIKCMRISYKKEVNAMLNWAEEMSVIGRESQKSFLKYSLHMFQQSILLNYTGQEIVQLNTEEQSFLKNFSRFISGNNILDFNHTFSDAHYQIERNANAKILFTDLCFKVMRLIHAA
jgi:DNA polymerase-3 subunit delta'